MSSSLSSMMGSLPTVLWHSKKVLARCKAGTCQPHSLSVFLGPRIVTRISACSSYITQPVICSYSIRKQMKTHLVERKKNTLNFGRSLFVFSLVICGFETH